MPKIYEKVINRFDGGMVADGRIEDETTSLLVKHFDIFTYPHKLVPRRTMAQGNSSQNTQELRSPIYYNGKLYAVRSVATTGIYSTDNFSDNPTWTVLNNGEPVSGALDPDCFVEYKGFGYGILTSGSAVWKVDLSDSTAFNNSENSLSTTAISVVQGLVHSKDDILYIPYNTANGGKIASNNNGSWTNEAISLPQGLLITSMSEYGNYIAIACKPLYYGNSVVYLWDRDASLSTLSESIDFGSGDLEVLEEIDGHLIGVSFERDEPTFNPRVTFRRYSGGSGAITIKEFEATGAAAKATLGSVSISTKKQKRNSRLFFPMILTLDGTDHAGVWAIARSSPFEEFTVSLDTRIGESANSISSFAVIGDYVFITYQTGSTDKMVKTSSQEDYDETSVYESRIFNEEDPSRRYSLLGVTVTTEALPTDGQVVLKYKKDSDSSWTTIFTNTTDNSTRYSSSMIESTGEALPEFSEIQFRIESTGGAEITSLVFRYEDVEDRNYA